MGTPDDIDQVPSDRWLPPHVLAALELSPVGAIKALQKFHGLGLFEAKLLVDAYMVRRADPMGGGNEEGTLRHRGALAPVALAEGSASVILEPGVPLSPEVLPGRARLPELYVFGRSPLLDQGRWASQLLRICVEVLGSSEGVEVVDERFASSRGDVADTFIKVCAPVSAETLSTLCDIVRTVFSDQASACTVRTVLASKIALQPADLEIEYFRREFAVNSQMVFHTASCAMLTHLPTGIFCRSTFHRSRIVNYEEALLLLQSLVREATLGATPKHEF